MRRICIPLDNRVGWKCRQFAEIPQESRHILFLGRAQHLIDRQSEVPQLFPLRQPFQPCGLMRNCATPCECNVLCQVCPLTSRKVGHLSWIGDSLAINPIKNLIGCMTRHSVFDHPCGKPLLIEVEEMHHVGLLMTARLGLICR